MWNECSFTVEYNPKEFIFINNWYFSIVKFDEKVIVHFSQLTEMYTLCFAFGDSETVCVYPMHNILGC